jgi:hypothetical protein
MTTDITRYCEASCSSFIVPKKVFQKVSAAAEFPQESFGKESDLYFVRHGFTGLQQNVALPAM